MQSGARHNLQALAVLSALAADLAGSVAAAVPSSMCERLVSLRDAKTPESLKAALKRVKLDARTTPVFGPFDSPDAMVRILATSSAFDRVRAATFERVPFSAETIAELGRSAHWRELRELDLDADDEPPAPSVLAVVADPTVFPALVKLVIGSFKHPSKRGEALAPALAALVASDRLHVLSLSASSAP